MDFASFKLRSVTNLVRKRETQKTCKHRVITFLNPLMKPAVRVTTQKRPFEQTSWINSERRIVIIKITEPSGSEPVLLSNKTLLFFLGFLNLKLSSLPL